jgi:hypothetical protein
MMVCWLLATYVSSGIAQQSNTPIKAVGLTTITRTEGRLRVQATFQTFQLDPSVRAHHFSQCTGSKIPCSLTEELSILVDGKKIFVPRSCYADLGDINSAAIDFANGNVLLIVSGGDASESYIAKFIFHDLALQQRELYSGEDSNHPLEITHYYRVSLNN